MLPKDVYQRVLDVWFPLLVLFIQEKGVAKLIQIAIEPRFWMVTPQSIMINPRMYVTTIKTVKITMGFAYESQPSRSIV